MKKVAFYTLGCKLNYAETSTISRSFEEKGYQKVDFNDTPDIYVINTCSVTENADKKCRKIVSTAKTISPDSYVVIIGCFAQLKPKEIVEIPGVDAVLGTSEKFKIVELLDTFDRPPNPIILSKDIKSCSSFYQSWSVTDRTRTFLKIQDGCDYSCSFCTIPLARGKSRSSKIKEVVIAAENIGNQGVKEIVLTGVNTGDFGKQESGQQQSFYDLICALDQVQTIERFRISSIEPNLLTNEIINFVANSKRFLPHFHIPLQSGSNKILKLMRRRYLKELYEERVNQIKLLMPSACIGVDVITGFPQETESDFLDSYHFINSLDVSYLHVFTYSERKDTPASTMDGVVSRIDRSKRSRMLHSLSEKKRRAFYEKSVNTIQSVLFENDIEKGQIFGFTKNYIRVSVEQNPKYINQIFDVLVNEIDEDCVALGEISVAQTVGIIN